MWQKLIGSMAQLIGMWRSSLRCGVENWIVTLTTGAWRSSLWCGIDNWVVTLITGVLRSTLGCGVAHGVCRNLLGCVVSSFGCGEAHWGVPYLIREYRSSFWCGRVWRSSHGSRSSFFLNLPGWGSTGSGSKNFSKILRLKILLIFLYPILQFNYPYLSIKDAQDTREAFSP